MRSRVTTLLAVLGATTMLVLAANTVALAATGHALLAGKVTNSRSATTINRTTPGPALVARTRSHLSAPLAVNGTGRVANLNADKVDGFDATTLRNRAFTFTAKPFEDVNEVQYVLPLPRGSYVVNYTSFFDRAGLGGIECFVTGADDSGGFTLTGYSSLVHTASNNWDPSLTGSGLVTRTSLTTVTVVCEAQGAARFSSDDEIPLRITATPVHVLSSRSIAPVAPALMKARHPG